MTIPGDVDWSSENIKESATGKLHTVVGIFRNGEAAQRAYDDLRDGGFTRDDVSIVARGSEAAQEVPSQAASEEASDATAIGTAVGGVGGGVIGALIGAGTIAVPGVGPLLAVGWLAGLLAGAITGAAAGGWIGSLVDLGVPEDVARRYGEEVAKGRFLVMVRATEGGQEQRAETILREAGATETAIYDYAVRPKEFPGVEREMESEAHDEHPPAG